MHRNEKQRARKRQVRRAKIALLVLFLAVCAMGAFLIWTKFVPTSRRMDERTYFEDMMSREGETVTLAADELAVVLEDTVAAQKARIIDEVLYLDYEMVRENLNTRFFWDEENQMLLYTTAYDTWEIPVNEAICRTARETLTLQAPVIISDERGLFLSAAYLQEYTNLEYVQGEAHVLVHYRWGTQQVAEVTGGAPVRYYGGVKALVLTNAQKGDTVRVLDQMERWSRIVTADGFIGYIPNRCLGEETKRELVRAFTEPEYPSIQLDQRVNLVWHMIGVAESNDYFAQDTEGMEGVNVISPTWFSLSDNEGNFTSLVSKSYVRKAHRAGLQVWGLVSNFSPDMSTYALVSSTRARRNLVEQLIEAALSCGMDGINVDLEAITEDSAYGYVQLVRELSVACRANNLVLSVDVPVPLAFNRYYDRKELGTVADYVIIMGYDEHYAGSEQGSVASLDFEQKGIEATLEDVPAEKIISGVPFYTRMWYLQTLEDGSEDVWSEVLGMRAVSTTLETYGVTPQWDDKTQQNLAQWTLEDGIACSIWIEDAASLALKADLVQQYELGGIAAWALGNQTDDIWEVLISHAGL